MRVFSFRFMALASVAMLASFSGGVSVRAEDAPLVLTNDLSAPPPPPMSANAATAAAVAPVVTNKAAVSTTTANTDSPKKSATVSIPVVPTVAKTAASAFAGEPPSLRISGERFIPGDLKSGGPAGVVPAPVLVKPTDMDSVPGKPTTSTLPAKVGTISTPIDEPAPIIKPIAPAMPAPTPAPIALSPEPSDANDGISGVAVEPRSAFDQEEERVLGATAIPVVAEHVPAASSPMGEGGRALSVPPAPPVAAPNRNLTTPPIPARAAGEPMPAPTLLTGGLDADDAKAPAPEPVVAPKAAEKPVEKILAAAPVSTQAAQTAPVSAPIDTQSNKPAPIVTSTKALPPPPMNDAKLKMPPEATASLPVPAPAASASKAPVAIATAAAPASKQLVIEPVKAQAAVAEKKAAPTKIVETFRARKGETLRDVLRRWSSREGIDLVWSMPNDVVIERDYSYVGDFNGAMNNLVAAYPQSGIKATLVPQGIKPIDQQQPYVAESQPPAVPPVPVEGVDLADFVPAMPAEAMTAQAWPKKAAVAQAPTTPAKAQAFGPVQRWRALQGASMRQVMQAWAEDAGITLMWVAREDFVVRSSLNVRGDYGRALTQLMDQYAHEPFRPVGQIYQDPAGGNKAVLVVRSYRR